MLVFSIYYPLKIWIRGKILCEFGFIMEYFCFFIVLLGIVAWAGICVPLVCITSVQDLLDFIVSREKSGVIPIGLPLYVT